jgi:hypothetical protein
MADVPEGTPVFTGPGEAADRAFLHIVVQGNSDRALEDKPTLSVGVGALGAGTHARQHRLPGAMP